MSGPLDKLCGPGKPLQIEAPDTNEFAGLLRSGTARLAATQAVAEALNKRNPP